MTSFSRTSNRILILVLLPSLTALFTGCTMTYSQHPLSDEETSQLDKRLIGHWRIKKFNEKEDPNLAPFIVGRTTGDSNSLEAVSLRLSKDDRVKVSRQFLFTRSVGEYDFLSLKTVRRNEVVYLICRYELEGRGAGKNQQTDLRLFAIDPNFVAQAIRNEELSGDANWYESPNKPDAKASWVKMTASPQQIAAFINKHPQKLFEQTPFLVLEKFRPGWQKQESK